MTKYSGDIDVQSWKKKFLSQHENMVLLVLVLVLSTVRWTTVRCTGTGTAGAAPAKKGYAPEKKGYAQAFRGDAQVLNGYAQVFFKG